MSTGSFINNVMGNTKPKQPEVGMGVTELCWTDRFPYTIIEVKDSKHITVQADTATRTDNRGMTDAQSYEYSPNPNGTIRDLSIRKDGRWREVGQGKSSHVYLIGARSYYYDYSF